MSRNALRAEGRVAKTCDGRRKSPSRPKRTGRPHRRDVRSRTNTTSIGSLVLLVVVEFAAVRESVEGKKVAGDGQMLSLALAFCHSALGAIDAKREIETGENRSSPSLRSRRRGATFTGGSPCRKTKAKSESVRTDGETATFVIYVLQRDKRSPYRLGR